MANRRLTTEEFIARAKEVHGDTYDYSDCEYIHSKIKVSINCRLHGTFIQEPLSHIKGYGCKKCGTLSQASRNRKNPEDFIKEASIIHNNFYDYSPTNYVDFRTKVTIRCKVHNDFEQFPPVHLRGGGCPLCAAKKSAEYNSLHCVGWSASSWQKSAEVSKEFDSFKVYILKLTNEDEILYKLGRTHRKAEARTKTIPYVCEIIDTICSNDSRLIFDLENELKRKYKCYKYLPKVPFKGMHECFKISLPIEDLQKHFRTLRESDDFFNSELLE
jgi:hypothetical protein